MSTLVKFVFITGFLFAAWNWGVLNFKPSLPYLNLPVCAGITGLLMIVLIVTGRNK